MIGIKEFFQGLVAEGVIPQEPANYDAVTLKIYIAHLEAENAELRARLEKAVELPYEVGDTIYKVYNLEFMIGATDIVDPITVTTGNGDVIMKASKDVDHL